MSQLADSFLGDRRIATMNLLSQDSSWLQVGHLNQIVRLRIVLLSKYFDKIFKLDSVFFATASVRTCGEVQAIKSL